MESVLDTLGQLLYVHGDHKGYLIEWDRISHFCKKWSRNRETDMKRVGEMIEFYNNGGYLPRIIHLAELQGEGLVCYDGNHRREVFNKIPDAVTCIVDVMFRCNNHEIFEAFENINKSVQVPAVYLQEHENREIKDEILELVRSYESKYKNLVSLSTRCRVPHFNRDVFMDNIYDIYRSFAGVYSIAELGMLLERLNEEYSRGILRLHSYYKPSAVDKCRKYGLWLFLERTIPFEHVRCVAKKRE